MANLAAARNTIRQGEQITPELLWVPLAANAKIFQGGLVGLNAGGYCVPAQSVPAGGVILGRAEPLPFYAAASLAGAVGYGSVADNTGGANGAINIHVRQGAFWWDNSAAGDQITLANIGAFAFAVDDHTVALTDGNGTRARAGIIYGVDSVQGVLVQTEAAYGGLWQHTISFGVTYASLANGTPVIAVYKPGYPFRIRKMTLLGAVAGAGVGATATLQLQVTGVACTGGALVPTLATATVNCNLDSTPITAGGQGTGADTISIAVSAVTAFTAGSGTIVLSMG